MTSADFHIWLQTLADARAIVPAEEVLKRAYFEKMKPADQDHFVSFEPLYRAWHHLGRWATKARSIFKSNEKSDSPDEHSADRGSLRRRRIETWKWIDMGS